LTLIVVDASITAAIILLDEATDRDDAIRTAFRTAALYVPAHWATEVASLLLKAERRGRITSEERNAHLGEAGALLATGTLERPTLSRATIDLAVEANLTAYDAAYLELALRLGASLASNDGDLNDAARARGVPILTTRP
jgi:predicted nucleic acid-binding protein